MEWTPYEPDWKPLPDSLRPDWTEEQAAVYDLYTFRNLSRRGPAEFAATFTPSFQIYDYISYINEQIIQLVENRLWLPSGQPADNLFVTMPPRHGKSFLISEHTPPWYLTRFPDHRVLLTSYEGDFAAGWGRRAKALLEDHGAKYGLQLDKTSQANSRWDLARPHNGGMNTAGLGGPINGKGGHLLIGDDWIKNSEEANSATFRDNAWDWVVSTFLTRRQIDPETQRPAKTILLMTRWHEDDPPGRLMKAKPEGWATVQLPALAATGDPLGREPGAPLSPLVTRDYLLEQQSLDSRWFEALFQGNPTPLEGGLFSASGFRTWRMPNGVNLNEQDGRAYSDTYILQTPTGDVPVPRKDCRHFVTVDLAVSLRTSADYTVFSTWASTPNNDLVLIDRWRDRIEGPDHLPRLQKYVDGIRQTGVKVLMVGVENKTFGTSLITEANRFSDLPIRALEADKDKYSRAIPASNMTQEGKVYLPGHAAWKEDFIGECARFPNGTHDDQVDTFSYAAEAQGRFFRRRRTGRGAAAALPTGTASTSSTEERLEHHVDKLIRRRKRSGAYSRARL